MDGDNRLHRVALRPPYMHSGGHTLQDTQSKQTEQREKKSEKRTEAAAQSGESLPSMLRVQCPEPQKQKRTVGVVKPVSHSEHRQSFVSETRWHLLPASEAELGCPQGSS